MIPLRDTIRSRTFPILTYFLIGLNVFVFLVENSLPVHKLDSLVVMYGIVPARVIHSPFTGFYTLFTSMFLHGGWTHLIGNMWALYLFGDNVEDVMGHLRFLIFYILAGVVAGLVHILFNPLSTVPTIGASGAIAGVMGAYFILFPRSTIITLVPLFFLPLFIEIPAVVFIGFWFLSQFFNGTLSLVTPGVLGGVAWWAHVGGFAFGLLFHKLFTGRRRKIYPDEIFPW
ncbi:rhomboid family intramembrane serine protease [candidate division WOR-3 bacterium]|nr:rhomboid family intramembrane serine protease [candidate division WOR-3 bacterium]